jgi:DNA modification methylase
MEIIHGDIIHGDCIEILQTLEPQSVDLVLTSPPYAEQRKNQYESISESEYPSWTTQWMRACKKILKPTGSVAIIIRTNLRKGRISDYVLRTRIALHDDGWMEPEELIWIKPDSPPLGSILRPRRAWENILWFAMNEHPFCDPKANGTPSNRIGFESIKGVGEYKSGTKKSTSGIARSKDYIEAGTSLVDKSKSNTHPAQFPAALASHVIKLLSPPEGTIVDPFCGSGTTAIACIENSRKFTGIEISKEYCDISLKRISQHN